MNPRPLTAVVAGAGLMGRWHAATLQSLGIPVSGIVDPDRERGKSLLTKVPSARWFPALDGALGAGLCDVVHVCAPLPFHVPMARQALDAGCHTIVEKPLAPSAGEVEDLYRRARAAHRLLCPVHQFLWQPGVQSALSRLPNLGTLRHVDIVACSAGAEGRAEADRPALVLEILPHALALMARLLPAPATLDSWHVTAPSSGELRLTAHHGPTSGGILISLTGRPTRNTLRLIAEGGTLHVDLFHGFLTFERARVSRIYKIARPFALALSTLVTAGGNLMGRMGRGEWAYPGLRALIRRFYDAADSDTSPPIPEDETLLVARWLDRIAADLPGGVSRGYPTSATKLERSHIESRRS